MSDNSVIEILFNHDYHTIDNLIAILEDCKKKGKQFITIERMRVRNRTKHYLRASEQKPQWVDESIV